jgi:hypothetical protein
MPPQTFTIQRLSEVSKGIQLVLNNFQMDDPSKVTSTIKNACACYREIFVENKKVSFQISLDPVLRSLYQSDPVREKP